MSNQPPSLTSPPFLFAENLRVDVRGAVAASGVTFASHAKSIAVVGDEYGLFAALEGAGEVRAGSLRIAGREVSGREHLRSGEVGLAPFDPPLPSAIYGAEYLTWSARLAGYGHARARDAAESTAGPARGGIARRAANRGAHLRSEASPRLGRCLCHRSLDPDRFVPLVIALGRT